MAAALPVLDSLLSIGEERQLELLLIDGTMDTAEEARLRNFVAEHPGVSCERLHARQLAAVFRPVNHPPDLVIASRRYGSGQLDQLLKLAACPVILSA